MTFLTQVNFCEEDLAFFYVHLGHFSGKEGILDVELFCYSSLIRSAWSGKETKKVGSDVGRSRVGGHSAFCHFNHQTWFYRTAQPCFPTTYAWYWVCILALPPSPYTVVRSLCAWRNHWCPPPPPASMRKVIKGTTLATCRCYINRLSWGQNQAGIYMPWRPSSLSSQPGTTPFSGPTWAHIVAAAQIQGFVLASLEAGTQDHRSSLNSQPKCLLLSLESCKFRWRRTTFYEEG